MKYNKHELKKMAQHVLSQRGSMNFIFFMAAMGERTGLPQTVILSSIRALAND